MGGSCGKNREISLAMIGLDQAGKTSIVNKLKFNEAGTTTPTVGFNLETIKFKNIDINIWDTGGQDKIRDLWKHYFEDAQGILYVVDSTDEQRLDEAKEALHKALHDINLQNAYVCILANKRDLKDRCLPVEEIEKRLQLTTLPASRRWNIIGVSALNGTGLPEALSWVASQKVAS